MSEIQLAICIGVATVDIPDLNLSVFFWKKQLYTTYGLLFLFFLLPMAEGFAEMVASGMEDFGGEPARGVASRVDWVPGVADVRVKLPEVSGISSVISGAENEAFEWRAVVCIARRRGRIFSCFFAEAPIFKSLLDFSLCFAMFNNEPESFPVSDGWSGKRFFDKASAFGVSTIGQIKPVRGVKSGRWARSVSNEDWSAWTVVSYVFQVSNQNLIISWWELLTRRLESTVYRSGDGYIRLYTIKYAARGRTVGMIRTSSSYAWENFQKKYLLQEKVVRACGWWIGMVAGREQVRIRFLWIVWEVF